VNDQGRCSRCGSEVVDRHMVSRNIPEPGAGSQPALASASAVPTEGKASTPAAPAAAGPTPSPASSAPSGGGAPPAATVRRPGCLTAYALLLLVSAALAGVGMILGGVEQARRAPAAGIGLILGGILTAALIGSLARGLWRMRSWARVVAMVLQGLTLVVYALGVVVALAGPAIPGAAQLDPASGLCGAVVGLTISASILGWFGRNRRLFDGVGQKATVSPSTQNPDRRTAKPLPLALRIGLLVLGVGALFLVLQPRLRSPAARSVETHPSATAQATLTTRPTATDRPTRTATPPPVEITFDDLANYPVGREVILTGRLALFSSTRCDITCGLLLEDIANPSHEITIFVGIPSPGQTAAPGEMDRLADQYVKSDIRVRTDDGTYAAVGFRIRITGEVCETTSGEPCINDITKIELVTVD